MATRSKPIDANPVRDSSTDVVTKTYSAWLDQVNKVNHEAFRFAHDRLTKDLEAAAHLARCSEPNEAFTLQVEFAEGQKMLELVSQLNMATRPEPGQNTRGRQHA
jgi:Phasin protein